MKQIFSLLICCFALQAWAQPASLIGKWKATQKNELVYMVFGEDSTFKMIHDEDTMGGKRFIFGESEATSAFKVDTSARPRQIDLIVTEKSSGTVIYRMKGVYEMIGPDKVRIRMNKDNGGERPKSFLPKGNEETLVFVRQ